MKAHLSKLCLLLFFGLNFIFQHGFSQVINDGHFLDLNGQWAFKIDPYDVGIENKWFLPQESTLEKWDKMEVPGNWDLRNEYAHYSGTAWYQKSFEVPESWAGKTVYIHFEAVSHDATVWVNGKLLGENNIGFLPFEFDVSTVLEIGKTNFISLQVNNSKRVGAIWNWGGIRRSVSLTASDGIKLISQYITPVYDYKNKYAEVFFQLNIQNHDSQSRPITGEILLKKADFILKRIPFDTLIQGNSKQKISLKTILKGEEVVPWNFDFPNLYTSEIILKDSEVAIHKDRFGLRTVELDTIKKQFLLNGEPIRAMGFNLVPDDRTTGNTLPLWRIKEDIDLMKAAGVNLARLSHIPLPKAALDYLDERGIMTFSEIPIWGFDPLAYQSSEIPKEWLRRLISSQYNHPSIVGWSVANEIGNSPDANLYAREAILLSKLLDSTRMATAVSHTAQKQGDFLEYSDFGLINKYGAKLRNITQTQHERHPDKLLFYSEYGIKQFGEDLNSDFDAHSLVEPLRGLPYLVGASLWTFNDYRSNYTATEEASENRSWGVVDVYRRKKKAYYSIRKEHAPVKDFILTKTSVKTASLEITPRMVLDLPSFVLRSYKVVWQILDEAGKVIESDWENLPDIMPGSTNLSRTIAWQSNEGSKLKVSLLNPHHDQVYDTSVDFKTPQTIAPLAAIGGRMNHNNLPPNSGSFRIFLDKNPIAEYHRGIVKKGQEIIEVDSVYENYMEFKNLEFSTPYEIAVYAVNSAGENLVFDEKLEIDPKKLTPPAIQHIAREKEGFFVGFATAEDDYQFKVRYSKSLNLNVESKIVTSTNPGVIFIPMENQYDQYFFQIQRVKDNFYFSEWSPTYKVPAEQSLSPEVPIIDDIKLKKGIAMIHFHPVKKAIGYQVAYREADDKNTGWKEMSISQSLIEFMFISNLNQMSDYEFKISTITSDGRSDYSPVFLIKQTK
jgi:beta-galactosidase